MKITHKIKKSAFFSYYIEKRRFQFFGRSYFDRTTTPEEWYHVVLKNQFAWSAEITRPRQGGEQYDQVYAIRGSVPIFIEDFIDKEMTAPAFIDDAPRTLEQSSNNPDSTEPDTSLSSYPDGDYFSGINYKK